MSNGLCLDVRTKMTEWSQMIPPQRASKEFLKGTSLILTVIFIWDAN